MIGKITLAANYLAGNVVPGRALRIFPDDTFIVSYPKSGNTWMRFLVANLIRPGQPITFLGADRVIPNVDGQSRRYFKSMPRPRVIKSHYPFEQNYKRVIYVVRDPRDVAVSQYHYQIKRKVLAEGHPMEEFVQRFLAGETCKYGSWGENVGSWLAARHGSVVFLLLRYEDMLKETETELAKVATFLGIEPTTQLLAQTVERSSADRMRKLERVEADQWGSTKDTRKDKLFVRGAKAGGWKALLSAECVTAMEARWGGLMRWLGYEVTMADQASGSFPLETILKAR